MKILYIASGIPVPGSLGGSTHTLEVARGLAERGHGVHVVATRAESTLHVRDLLFPATTRLQGVSIHHIDLPKLASLLALATIMRLARAIRPDVIIERYYNFAGCGVIAARRLGIPCLLEVNALIVDPPTVRKRRIDDALGGPLRRWATLQCQWANRIVTPLQTTVPAEIAREKIIELPWGANVERFAPHAGGSGQDEKAQVLPIVVFLGSFRAWHGVLDFVHAAGRLIEGGCAAQFLLIGDGPQRREAEQLAARWPGHLVFTGAVAYEQVPALLAQADVGVAPFNTAPHPALRAAGFFWSPLKVYEYMAAGLPVVTADIAPLNQVVRAGVEGLLFHEGDVAGLAAAIAQLLDDRAAARAIGQRGRERVVAHYSWARHCQELERIMCEMLPDRDAG